MNLSFDNQPWRLLAACKTYDPGLFFPGPREFAKARHAKAICKGCPVKDDCLGYALPNTNISGIWGGTSDRERGRIRGKKIKVKISA